MIRKMLKYQLPSESDPEYLQFIRDESGLIPHHFTKGFKGKKHNDYLAYPVDHIKHDDIHTRGIEDQEIATFEIIKHLIKYIKFLKT